MFEVEPLKLLPRLLGPLQILPEPLTILQRFQQSVCRRTFFLRVHGGKDCSVGSQLHLIGFHCDLLVKLRSISVGEQFLFVIKGSACVWMVASVRPLLWFGSISQGSVLGSLLFILYTFELFYIVGNHTVGYAVDTTIYEIIPRPFSVSQVMQSPNQDLAAIHSW